MEAQTKPLIKQGWLRALLYSIVTFFVLVVFQMIATAASENLLTGEVEGLSNSFTGFMIAYAVISVGVFLITWLFRKFIDRESFRSLGFYWSGFTGDAWMGFFTGPAILGIGTIILVVAGYLTFIDYTFNAFALLSEALILIVVAFTEEILFRGYVLNNLMQSINRWIALLISAVLFALFHGANPDITILAIVNIFVAGFLLGINYIYTKNLWFAIFFHFSWNFFQGPILGYDVSGLDLQSVLQQTLSGPELLTGGQFGFEGSLLCPVLIAITTLSLGFVFNRKYGDDLSPIKSTS